MHRHSYMSGTMLISENEQFPLRLTFLNLQLQMALHRCFLTWMILLDWFTKFNVKKKTLPFRITLNYSYNNVHIILCTYNT